jgi:hypothetical protein
MIIKIFPSSATFNGVSYNTGKVGQNRGELMKVSGFGLLSGLEKIKPEDYVNYLRMLSALNKRISKPQLHAVISSKGRSCDKVALTVLASVWLKEMGYGEQPYLVVFHKDTANNHVHMVSTRVDRSGKMISNAFEHIRAVQNLNKILAIDEGLTARQDITESLSYRFSSQAEFKLILESRGYVLEERAQRMCLVKFGRRQAEIALEQIKDRISQYSYDTGRAGLLKAIFEKYKATKDTGLRPQTTSFPGGMQKAAKGFTSDLSAFLKEEFGIHLVYQAAAAGIQPTGYMIVDHSAKMVLNGDQIMPLGELISPPGNRTRRKRESNKDDQAPSGAAIAPIQMADRETRIYYGALLKACLYNYPDLNDGLERQGFSVVRSEGTLLLLDPATQLFIPVSQLLSGDDLHFFCQAYHGKQPDCIIKPAKYRRCI